MRRLAAAREPIDHFLVDLAFRVREPHLTLLINAPPRQEMPYRTLSSENVRIVRALGGIATRLASFANSLLSESRPSERPQHQTDQLVVYLPLRLREAIEVRHTGRGSTQGRSRHRLDGFAAGPPPPLRATRYSIWRRRPVELLAKQAHRSRQGPGASSRTPSWADRMTLQQLNQFVARHGCRPPGDKKPNRLIPVGIRYGMSLSTVTTNRKGNAVLRMTFSVSASSLGQLPRHFRVRPNRYIRSAIASTSIARASFGIGDVGAGHQWNLCRDALASSGKCQCVSSGSREERRRPRPSTASAWGMTRIVSYTRKSRSRR